MAVLPTLLCALAPACGAQEPAGDPEAVALLRAVAREQFRADDARPVDGVRLRLNLRERGEDPREIGFELHYSTRDGETIRLHVDDPDRGVRVAKGFDGRRYWLREGDGEPIDLGGHEYEKDRRSIDEALDLCADLLLLVDFRQLLRRADELALEPAGDGRALGGRLAGAARAWRFRLVLPDDGLQPKRLVLREPAPDGADGDAAGGADRAAQRDADPEDAGPAYQRYELEHYKRFQRRAVPQVISMYRSPDEDALPRRILEIRDFVWDLAPRAGDAAAGEDQRR